MPKLKKNKLIAVARNIGKVDRYLGKELVSLYSLIDELEKYLHHLKENVPQEKEDKVYALLEDAFDKVEEALSLLQEE